MIREHPPPAVLPMKPAGQHAAADLPQVRTLAARIGISIRVTEIRSTGVPSLNVMFNDSRENRLLNWWPGTGLTIQGKDITAGKRGQEDSLSAAFGAAVLVRNEQQSEEVS